jgi:DUF1365 family protein
VTHASCIYEGVVRHRRHEPVQHELSYRVALMYLDLAELPSLDRLWSPVARFRRSDYLAPHDVPLDEAVRRLVSERTGARPEGPVRMLAHLRYLGHCFNPVAFYYCFEPSGTRVESIVAEVTNTPWGERHQYVLSPGSGSTEKAFHVSPFMGMDHRYEWRVPDPGEKLIVHIDSVHDGRRAFDATLSLRRRELDRISLRRVLWRYPAATLALSARIYTQALKLKLKGAPYFPHPREAPR